MEEHFNASGSLKPFNVHYLQSDGLLRACLCVRADQLEKVRQGRCKFFSTGAKATFLLTITPLIAEFMNFLYPNFRGATSNEGSSGKSWPEPLKEFFHLVNGVSSASRRTDPTPHLLKRKRFSMIICFPINTKLPDSTW
ncbi:uncharacterized protein LOC129582499 isoform X4 [Paramacrobiotus metropolitanus]|uniref:uncharacterized protein LOC129582499 isoform X4 n=1 Tax=Paramacrobiotus metropolitanus TaxID=2943436 RepID=UPI00244573E6|nr:uncharacterized protein LOC129582499 isoform X4 [Paramacrobiotus metropolitanus]